MASSGDSSHRVGSQRVNPYAARSATACSMSVPHRQGLEKFGGNGPSSSGRKAAAAGLNPTMAGLRRTFAPWQKPPPRSAHLGANLAHPFENPNGATNILETSLLAMTPFVFPWTFGKMVGSRVPRWSGCDGWAQETRLARG